MCALEVKIERPADGWLHVHLAGVIDESADLGAIFKDLDGDAVFHLRAIERINSPGILQWAKNFSKFTAKFRARVEAVSYPMAIQANCVSNLFVDAQVWSCIAPFFCPRCKVTVDVLVGADELSGDAQPPLSRCTRCHGELDFDELDSYFRFLSKDVEQRAERQDRRST
jgi:hypothetical protein